MILVGNEDQEKAIDLDKIIHEPARLQLMAQLYVVEEADFIFLMRQTGLTWGNLSSHMSKLEDAGYIEVRKEFQDKKPRTILRMTTVGREAFDQYRAALDEVLKEVR